VLLAQQVLLVQLALLVPQEQLAQQVLLVQLAQLVPQAWRAQRALLVQQVHCCQEMLVKRLGTTVPLG
jgi:hypothetical protein